MLCTFINIGQKTKILKMKIIWDSDSWNQEAWILAWFEGVFLRIKFKSEPSEKKLSKPKI